MTERLQTGLLWYDGNPKTELASKVEQAVARYRQKYGQAPNACLVHEGELEREIDCCGVRVAAAPYVLPGHFWVGISEKACTGRGAG